MLLIIFIIICNIYEIVFKICYSASTYDMKNTENKGKDFIESKLIIDLTKKTQIIKVNLEGWHEIVLFALIKIPKEEFHEFSENINAIATEEKLHETDLKHNTSWWNIKADKCLIKYVHNNNVPTSYVILKPKDNYYSVYIESLYIYDLTDEEWNLFK